MMEQDGIQGAGSEENREAGLPSLTESLLALGLLLIAGVGCWLMYGPLMGLMVEYARQGLK